MGVHLLTPVGEQTLSADDIFSRLSPNVQALLQNENTGLDKHYRLVYEKQSDKNKNEYRVHRWFMEGTDARTGLLTTCFVLKSENGRNLSDGTGSFNKFFYADGSVVGNLHVGISDWKVDKAVQGEGINGSGYNVVYRFPAGGTEAVAVVPYAFNKRFKFVDLAEAQEQTLAVADRGKVLLPKKAVPALVMVQRSDHAPYLDLTASEVFSTELKISNHGSRATGHTNFTYMPPQEKVINKILELRPLELFRLLQRHGVDVSAYIQQVEPPYKEELVFDFQSTLVPASHTKFFTDGIL